MAVTLLRRGLSPRTTVTYSPALPLIPLRSFLSGFDAKDPSKNNDDFERRGLSDRGKPRSVESITSLLNSSASTKPGGSAANSRSGTVRSNNSQFLSMLGGGFGLDSLNDGINKSGASSAGAFISKDDIYGGNNSSSQDVDSSPGQANLFGGLDFTKPTYQRKRISNEFETTTSEVLRKADFRNVRFLGNFLSDAGLIIKRSQTRISAKAQRKVVREIKTARAFGLMPFTTMGKKRFVFGRSIQDEDNIEREFDDYDNSSFRSPTFVADSDAE